MGVFTRMRDIVSANINAMLEKAEDPEKLLKMMVREMEDAIIEVKASCAGLMATRRKVERELNEVGVRAKDWESKAEVALNHGREDLAREALSEKRRYSERATTLEQELTQVDGLIAQARDDISQLEAKLKTVREKQRLMVQRHRTAQRRKQAQTTIRRVDTSHVMARFEHFEQSVDRMEAEADLVNFGRKPTVDEQLAKWQRDETIEKELEALKAKRAQNQPQPVGLAV